MCKEESTTSKAYNSKNICEINKKAKNDNSLQQLRSTNGITLIALVVTIVILIILATISIGVLFGENGLIKKAQEAKQHQSNAVAMEEGEMDKLAEEYANIMASEGNGGGSAGLPPLEEVTVPENWDSTKVKAIKSEDEVTVPVPIGYTYSGVEGERRVDTGFVIKEGDNGGLTEGVNEFVWVPVENISDLYDSTNNAGQLWDFGTSSSPKNPAEKLAYPTEQNSDYREPDVVTGASSGSDSTTGSECDADPSNLQQTGLSITTAAEFKTQLQNEFIEMKNSVEKYGGFYIGRYETGNLSSTTEAVVQKNNEDINNQTWYTQYKLNKTIAVNNNVKTSMIWGCQWDATLRWMQNYGTTDEVKNFPTNSEGKGNYKGTQGDTNKAIPTGSNPSYAVNNIFDMAGNVFDWTLEARDYGSRGARGGFYNNTASGYPASYRNSYYTTYINSNGGSRSTLYVAL